MKKMHTLVRRPLVTGEMARVLESVLSCHGFKWSHRQFTDTCGGPDIVVSFKGDEISVAYANISTSVFSKSVATCTKVEVAVDLAEHFSFVHVSKRVQHYDWSGAPVH